MNFQQFLSLYVPVLIACIRNNVEQTYPLENNKQISVYQMFDKNNWCVEFWSPAKFMHQCSIPIGDNISESTLVFALGRSYQLFVQ